MRSILLALGLMLSINAFAANTPPGYDLTKWNQLVATIIAKGDTMQITGLGEVRYLTQTTGAPDQAHHASYISTLGNPDDSGTYVVSDMSAVDEDWQTVGEGEWTVDQYIYHLSATGDVVSIDHSVLTEVNGQVTGDQTIETGAVNDPKVLAQWGQLLTGWFTYAGSL